SSGQTWTWVSISMALCYPRPYDAIAARPVERALRPIDRQRGRSQLGVAPLQQRDAAANEVPDRGPPSLAQRDQASAVGRDPFPGRPAARDAVQVSQAPEQLEHLGRGQRRDLPHPGAQEVPPARRHLGVETVSIGPQLAEERWRVGEDRVEALIL